MVGSRRLYGMNYRVDRALKFCRNRIGIGQELMEIFKFFHAILLILLSLRISTGQRFRKEHSVQDAYMGCIVEYIERLNAVKTDSESHKTSWR